MNLQCHILVMKHHFSYFIDQKCWSIEGLRSKLSHKSKCPNQNIFSVARICRDFSMVKVGAHISAQQATWEQMYTLLSHGKWPKWLTGLYLQILHRQNPVFWVVIQSSKWWWVFIPLLVPWHIDCTHSKLCIKWRSDSIHGSCVNYVDLKPLWKLCGLVMIWCIIICPDRAYHLRKCLSSACHFKSSFRINLDSVMT